LESKVICDASSSFSTKKNPPKKPNHGSRFHEGGPRNFMSRGKGGDIWGRQGRGQTLLEIDTTPRKPGKISSSGKRSVWGTEVLGKRPATRQNGKPAKDSNGREAYRGRKNGKKERVGP